MTIAVLYPKGGSGIAIFACICARVDHVCSDKCEGAGKARKQPWMIRKRKTDPRRIPICVRVDVYADFMCSKSDEKLGKNDMCCDV